MKKCRVNFLGVGVAAALLISLPACGLVEKANDPGLRFAVDEARKSGFALVAANVKADGPLRDMLLIFRQIDPGTETLKEDGGEFFFHEAEAPQIRKIPAGTYALVATPSDQIQLGGGYGSHISLGLKGAPYLGAIVDKPGPSTYYVHKNEGVLKRVAEGASVRGITAFRFHVKPGEFVNFGTLDLDETPHAWKRNDVELKTALQSLPNVQAVDFTYRPPSWTAELP